MKKEFTQSGILRGMPQIARFLRMDERMVFMLMEEKILWRGKEQGLPVINVNGRYWAHIDNLESWLIKWTGLPSKNGDHEKKKN